MNDGFVLKNFIENQKKLSKMQIANDLSITRSTLYGYFNSKILEPETKKRLEDYFGKQIFSKEAIDKAGKENFYKIAGEIQRHATDTEQPPYIAPDKYIKSLEDRIQELKDDKDFLRTQLNEKIKLLEVSLEKVLSIQEDLTIQLRAGLMYLADHFAGDDPKKKVKEKEHVDKLISAARR